MLKSLTDNLRLISDETRLRILLLLKKKKLCVCEICAILDEPQPKVSQHLAKLKSGGLILDERKGQFIYYDLAENEIIDEILNTILKNTNIYPVLKSDLEKIDKIDFSKDSLKCKTR